MSGHEVWQWMPEGRLQIYIRSYRWLWLARLHAKLIPGGIVR